MLKLGLTNYKHYIFRKNWQILDRKLTVLKPKQVNK